MKQPRINQHLNNLVGGNIRRLREERGLRNRDVVCRLQLAGVDISASTYCKIEAGTNNPSVDLLAVLTGILDCDFNAFFVDDC